MADDILGMAHDAEGRHAGGFCISVKGYYAQQIKTRLKGNRTLSPSEEHDLVSQNLSAILEELHRLEAEVYTGKHPCPLQATCLLYLKAVQQGRTMQRKPLQLGLQW